MFTIRKATVADCELIHMMAKEVFPATYKDILSPEQLDYMMDWMYAPSNVRKQMEEEGHVYSIAYKENEPCGYVSVQQQEKDLAGRSVRSFSVALHPQKLQVAGSADLRTIGFIYLPSVSPVPRSSF